jgi:hypothetical protein
MREDVFLAFLDSHRQRLERLARVTESLDCARKQIEWSRVAIATSRALLARPVITLGDLERRLPN